MDASSAATRPRLSRQVGMLVNHFESVVYGFAFLLLMVAAILVLIGGVEAIAESATLKVGTLEGGVLVLDRILLLLIIAELASTLSTILLHHEIAAEPFLFIGLIATVRRILIVTAAFEQPRSHEELNHLLLELGALGLLVLAIAAAIFMIRYSARRDPLHPIPERRTEAEQA